MENPIPRFTITYSNGKIRYMDSYRFFPGVIIFNSNNSGKLAVPLDELRPDNIQIINNEEGRDVSAEIYHDFNRRDPADLQRQADRPFVQQQARIQAEELENIRAIQANTKREERQKQEKLRLDRMARHQREFNNNDNLLSGKNIVVKFPLDHYKKERKQKIQIIPDSEEKEGRLEEERVKKGRVKEEGQLNNKTI
jgi:hypothetical protein